MQNNFERDVQRKMDELRLTPSAQVWEKVELEIKEEKRRRRGLLWFLLAGLLLLGGGWILYRQTNSHPAAMGVLKAPSMPVPANQEAGLPVAINHKLSSKRAQSLPQTSQKSTSSTPSANVNSAPVKARQSVSLPQPQQGEKIPAVQRNGTNQPATVPTLVQTRAPSVIQPKDTPSNTPPVQEVPSAKVVLQHTPASSTASGNAEMVHPAVVKNPLTLPNDSLPAGADSTTKKEAPKDTVVSKPDPAGKRKVASALHWRKQLTFGAGISGYAEGPLFQAFNSASRDAYLASVGVANAPQVTVAAQPSAITSGFSFSVGFALAKSLGRRWEFSVGLQYAYASTHQKVGDKKGADSTVSFAADKSIANGFYTNTGTTAYTNRFHFVEVPVSLSFRPSLRLPLYLAAGAAYGRLLSTTALTFSSASNLYYQNKENYLRNALSFSVAGSMEFFGKKKLRLRTGPFVQYNLLRLRQENGSDVPHLVTAGLRTAIIF